MKQRTRILIVLLLLALLLCAYSPGGRGRIPVPGRYITPTLTAVSADAGEAAPGMGRMPPRLRGTPMPPICHDPDGPRC